MSYPPSNRSKSLRRGTSPQSCPPSVQRVGGSPNKRALSTRFPGPHRRRWSSPPGRSRRSDALDILRRAASDTARFAGPTARQRRDQPLSGRSSVVSWLRRRTPAGPTTVTMIHGRSRADQVAGGGAAAVVQEAGRPAGRLTGGAPGPSRVETPVRLEFPILSGESAPPVWRQPNVDHVGSWRATAPGRTVAACVQRALLDSHPVSAKRPEDGGSVHTIVRVGASSRCCCRTARR